MIGARFQNWFDGLTPKGRIAVLIAFFLVLPALNEVLWAVIFALPTAMQLLLAMLTLMAVSLFVYDMLKNYPEPLYILILAGYLVVVPLTAGVYPDVLYPLLIAITAVMLRELASDVWTGLHRRLA